MGLCSSLSSSELRLVPGLHFHTLQLCAPRTPAWGGRAGTMTLPPFLSPRGNVGWSLSVLMSSGPSVGPSFLRSSLVYVIKITGCQSAEVLRGLTLFLVCRWKHPRQCLHLQLQEGSFACLHSAQLTRLNL